MDAPIYIHHIFFLEGEELKPFKNRLYVIEGRDGATSGIEQVALTDKDRIGVYDLPVLDDVPKRCSMFITRSRLFIVGAFEDLGKKQGIRHLTFDSPSSSWEKTPIGDDFLRVAGMTVFNSNQMVCFGLKGNNFSLLPHDDIPRVSPLNFPFPFPAERWYAEPVPVADTPDGKIYIFWEPHGELGYYQDGEWHTIDPETQWPSFCNGAVAVNDKYLITYADLNPVTLEYAPDLYVCDISSGDRCQWLPEPVMGLLHDDACIPIPTPPGHRYPNRTLLSHSSLMQISPDKYAFIWCRDDERPHPQPEEIYTLPQCYMELRCTKFTLSVEDGPHPTFRAHICSHIGCVCDGVTFNLDSTLMNPYPSSFNVTTSKMLPLKRKSEADLDSGAEHKVGSFLH